MTRLRGKTSERGLTGAHRAMRRRLLPLAYGTPCPLCGELMVEGQALDLDHIVPRAFGGRAEDGQVQIAHARCNRANGSRIRVALHRRWATPGSSEIRSRNW